MDVLFNKPFGVMSQFSGEDRVTLRQFVPVPDVYPAGRLDQDSEGLLLLTSDGRLQHRLTDPRSGHPRTYWAQVEGDIRSDAGTAAIRRLTAGVDIQDYRTRPARVRAIDPPQLWDRQPPIRYRAAIPVSWVELILTEGRNRQVRRMTAAVGFPTLRLVRVAIGPLRIEGLAPGEWRRLTEAESRRVRQFPAAALK